MKTSLTILALLAIAGCASTEASKDQPDGARSAAGATGAAGMTAAAGATGSAGATTLDAGATGSGDAGDATIEAAGSDATDAAGDVVDASTETASGPDAAGVCKTSGVELCDGFESGAVDPKVWTQRASGGASLAVDGTHVHGGAFALHVKLVAGKQQTAQLADAVTFPAKSNTFYTRAWVYFDPDLPADNMGGFHMAFLLATGNNDLGFVEAGLGSAGDKQWLGYSEYYGAGPDVHAHGPTFTEFGPRSNLRIAPKTWTCLELMQGGDATTTHRRVWVNDVELTEQKNDYEGRKPPAFSAVSIGVLQYHPTPILTDVWFDDVRVSATRVGCGAN
jgi:hypothetical protein